MVKILVRAPTGSKIFRVAFSDQVKDFIKQIAESFQYDPEQVHLYIDHNLTKPVNESNHILKAKIPDINKFPVVYVKYTGKLPEGETATLTSYSNAADEFIGKEDADTPEIQNFQAMWGKRAVGASFFDIRKRKLPVIDLQTESSCFKIRIGQQALERFKNIAFSEGFASHRVTFLFGRINKITGTITVHCSCEPQQTNYPDHVEISTDFDISIPLLIADCFGMECVGIAISHLADRCYPMTQYMVQLAAFYHNFFNCEYFTTLVVTPNPDDQTKVQMEAYQVSDAAVKLDRAQLFAPSNDPHKVNFTEEILNTYENKKSKECHVNLLLTPVRIKRTDSKFPSHEFPSPSQYPTPVDFIAYMKNKESCPTWLQLFDFNVLVFLVTENVVTENDLPYVIDSIIKMEDIQPRIMAGINRYIQLNTNQK